MPATQLQQFIIVLLYGSLVLQSFMVLVNPMNVNKRANVFFGLFLFFWSSFWLLDIIALCGMQEGPVLIQTIYFLHIYVSLLLGIAYESGFI